MLMTKIVKRSVLSLLLIFLVFSQLTAQDLSGEKKFEYSSYLYFKVNKKIYIDNFNLMCFDSRRHIFNFMQNDLTFNYKVTKTFILMFGDAIYINNWSPQYLKAYRNQISLGAIYFHRPTIGAKYKFNFTKRLELEENVTFQYFTPSMEKYHSRITLGSKLSYDNRKWPLEFEPFAQMILYYYLNGEPINYYNSEGGLDGYYSPNGLHRYRYRLGFKIKPVKAWKKFDLMLYVAGQKEFNLPGLGGHNINYTTPTKDLADKQSTSLPFNDYSILGFQLNHVFGTK